MLDVRYRMEREKPIKVLNTPRKQRSRLVFSQLECLDLGVDCLHTASKRNTRGDS